MLEDLQPNEASEYELDLSEESRRQLHAAMQRGKLPPYGYFQICAVGEAFDVDAFLRTTPLAPDRVWRRGEGHYQSSGVRIRLGDGWELPVDDQQRIAVEFVSAHRDSLQALTRFPGVTGATLGLQVNAVLGERRVECLSPWGKLMQFALDIGMELTFCLNYRRSGDEPPYEFSWEAFLQGW